jgi:hypothetical protein
MRKRSFFAALLALLVVSIVFLSCDPKEDDNTTKPTPTTNIVKEVHDFYGMPTAKAKSILDKKGLTKKVNDYGTSAEIYYYSPDTTKLYYLFSVGDTIRISTYSENESAVSFGFKLAENFSSFLQTFEKWEPLMNNIKPSDAIYQGYIRAEGWAFQQNYSDRTAFLADYNTKKPTLSEAYSGFGNEKMYGNVEIYLDYNAKNSSVKIIFSDNGIDIIATKLTHFPKGIK